MKNGPTPAAQVVFFLREENQRLFAENRHLQEQIANLKRQVENWRKAAGDPEGFLRCAICRCMKPTTEFWRDRSRIGGYRSYCRTCDKARYPQIDGRHRRLPVVEVVDNEHLEKA